MLRNIKLTHFKCFENLELGCTSLNLLCGLNGMGKSSILQALLVLRQSYETGELSRGSLVLAGTRVDLGAGSDVMFENAQKDEVGFSLESDRTTKGWELSFDYMETADQLSVVTDKSGTEMNYVPERWGSEPPFGGNMVYVNAERPGPRKSYPISYVHAVRGDFGPNGEYAWNYLNQHQNDLLEKNDPRSVRSGSLRLLDVVNLWLQNISPGVNLKLDAVMSADAVITGFSYDQPGDVASRKHRAVNVGFGLSYILPVILALLSPPETLCLIENPEAHLHPRGQTKLAELAARAAVAGVQVFVETHSDHFIDGIRIAVHDKLIDPEDVSIHYFERDGSKCVVTSPRVYPDGRLSAWPDGFFDQHEENLARLITPGQ